jgi:hypothetical protein
VWKSGRDWKSVKLANLRLKEKKEMIELLFVIEEWREIGILLLVLSPIIS